MKKVEEKRIDVLIELLEGTDVTLIASPEDKEVLIRALKVYDFVLSKERRVEARKGGKL